MTKKEARETLISILRDVNSDEQDMSVSPEDFTNAMLIAIDVLQEDKLMTYNAFKVGFIKGREAKLSWISVKDRLPEKNGWYFTCVEQAGVAQCVDITYFDKKTDGWYNEIPMTKRILVSTIEIVDYWMEIPELPMKDEK